MDDDDVADTSTAEIEAVLNNLMMTCNDEECVYQKKQAAAALVDISCKYSQQVHTPSTLPSAASPSASLPRRLTASFACSFSHSPPSGVCHQGHGRASVAAPALAR
jgi:hypothetical protein